jgi:hypothetical protein
MYCRSKKKKKTTYMYVENLAEGKKQKDVCMYVYLKTAKESKVTNETRDAIRVLMIWVL